LIGLRPTIRVPPARAVAFETTLLAHGVPCAEAKPLAHQLDEIARAEGADPALIGIVAGRPVVGMTHDELDAFLRADVPKLNTSNLGVACHRALHGATTVSATMEIAAAAGVRVFATGGIGGVHHGYATRLDISADLAALARFPVAVVCSGVKSIIDVESTREALESLGVPVVGFGTDVFPAFYLRHSGAGVDARFDDPADLASFVSHELARSGRGILIANPIPEDDELDASEFAACLERARAETADAQARDVTPRLLARLHELSKGATLQANLSLVRANTRLAARLAANLPPLGPP
jgi:pseudouridine-5'-phosphate glycosidase